DAGFHRFDDVVAITATGDHHERRLAALITAAHRAQQFFATHVGHLPVRENQVHLLAPDGSQRATAIHGFIHLHTGDVFPQMLLDHVTDKTRIVNDENTDSHRLIPCRKTVKPEWVLSGILLA